MARFLRNYLLITGVLAFLALTMPSLVIIGMLALIVPGMVLALMPTAFLYGAVFASVWYPGRRYLGTWAAGVAGAALAAVVAWRSGAHERARGRHRCTRSARRS